MCSKGLRFQRWEMPLFWYLSPSVQWLEVWVLPCSSEVWGLCLSELGIPEPHFLLLPSEGVHCLPSFLCSRSQWLLGICLLDETDQSNTAQTSGGHFSSRRGKNLGLEKGNHQSLFHFSKLFVVEVACTAPTVMEEHSSSFTWVPLVFAKVVLFSVFLDPLHPFFTSSTCSVSQTQTQPEGCCRPVYRLQLLHPNLQASCGKMRMLWGNAAAALLTPDSRKLLHGLFLWRKEINVAFSDLYFQVESRICKTFFFFF